MYKIEDIRDIHLELTSKCQARCPMCPRRINGGLLNPLIKLEEINLGTFIAWFPKKFVQQLDSLFMCGNLGDPIIAQDCLEILEYLRICNPNIVLRMHTNGSARNTEWWCRLAKTGVTVIFGLDGLEDTHNLHRINTDWKTIIGNAESFIQAGGQAEWHMLVFEHNEHQTGACQHMADQMGFKQFSIKHTSRFLDDKLHVLDDSGKTLHVIRPTQKSKDMTSKVKDAVIDINNTTIHCKAKHSRQFYVAADGTISPCCWLDFSWILPKQDSRIDYMDAIGLFPNLYKNSLEEIFDSGYFQKIEDTWAVKPLLECKRQCGKFDKSGAQFEN